MANQVHYPVRTMCRVLRVSHGGYYAWRDRQPSARAVADLVLTERIRAIHAASDATHGAPRVRAELADQGTYVSRKACGTPDASCRVERRQPPSWLGDHDAARTKGSCGAGPRAARI